jgi:hypothetical protein
MILRENSSGAYIKPQSAETNAAVNDNWFNVEEDMPAHGKIVHKEFCTLV